MIKRILFAATAWALLAFCTFGQSTLVSATVTDSSGQAWLSGSYKFTFYPSPSNPFEMCIRDRLITASGTPSERR